MLKQISLTNGAVEYLYSILTTEHAHDKATMNKLKSAFAVVSPVRNAFQDKGKEIKKTFEEPKEVKQPDGTTAMKKVIPAEKMDDFNKALEDCSNEKVTIGFERNVLSFVKTVIDNVFQREDLKGGLNGADQVEMYTEVSGEVDRASGIKEAKEPEGTEDEGAENGAAPADANAEAGTDVATA